MRPQNQTLMALIMACVMSLGFIGVYATGYYYQNNTEPEIVFSSDSNMEFGALNLGAYYLEQGFPEITTGSGFPGLMTPMYYYIHDVSYGDPDYLVIHRSNITCVYTGNETWGGAVSPEIPLTDAYRDGSSIVYIPVLLPDLDSYLISTINVTMTLPGDSDQAFEIYLSNTNNPFVTATDLGYHTRIQSLTSYDSDTEYSETFTMSQYQTLKIYSGAHQRPYHILVLELYDSSENGMSAFNMALHVDMTGVMATTWTQMEAIELVLGISIAGNVIVMAYMTDSLDFGGYRKDLSGKRAWSPKRKSGKRR